MLQHVVQIATLYYSVLIDQIMQESICTLKPAGVCKLVSVCLCVVNIYMCECECVCVRFLILDNYFNYFVNCIMYAEVFLETMHLHLNNGHFRDIQLAIKKKHLFYKPTL